MVDGVIGQFYRLGMSSFEKKGKVFGAPNFDQGDDE